ncbi:MAG: hypothetical protein AAFY03_10515, partial [Pseudomonadota bacterium]
GVFAIPSLLRAFSESRPPKVAAFMALLAAGAIGYAVVQKPGGYSFAEVPQIFTRLIGEAIN